MRRWKPLPSYRLVLIFLLVLFTVQAAISVMMRFSRAVPSLLAAAQYVHYGNAAPENGRCSGNTGVSLQWHPPASTQINDLEHVINGTGIYGFIFNSSQGPLNTYDWCNMPHTNTVTYPKPDSNYKLQ